MGNRINRILIETVVRKALKDIQKSPGRGTRNLVDMALNFAEGRFQRSFFETAQTMLKNQNSAYYDLVADVVQHTNAERLVGFGMNLGFNSCTVGAAQIREIEETNGFNIPWTLSVVLRSSDDAEVRYRKAVLEGQALGIYTWMLYCMDNPAPVLNLVREFPQQAFILFCAPDEISEALLDDAESLHNIMFAVCFTEAAADVCRQLRERKYLYSLYLPYDAADTAQILNGDVLADAEPLHPVFTAFLAKPDCPPELQKAVYQYVARTRAAQNHRTIAWDVIHDGRYIDGIISDDSCAAGFTPDGTLWIPEEQHCRPEGNLFRQPLRAILQNAFPKAAKGTKVSE